MKVIIVWCDSAQGLISTRVDFHNNVLQFDEGQLPDLEVLSEATPVFDILKKQDGTKIAIPVNLVYDILGWDISGNTNGDPAQSSTSTSDCA